METTIILTDIEAELFKKFIQHRELFTTLELTGALDTQFGKVVIHYSDGKFQKIDRDYCAWKR